VNALFAHNVEIPPFQRRTASKSVVMLVIIYEEDTQCYETTTRCCQRGTRPIDVDSSGLRKKAIQLSAKLLHVFVSFRWHATACKRSFVSLTTTYLCFSMSLPKDQIFTIRRHYHRSQYRSSILQTPYPYNTPPNVPLTCLFPLLSPQSSHFLNFATVFLTTPSRSSSPPSHPPPSSYSCGSDARSHQS
jgi:hypothetical protein